MSERHDCRKAFAETLLELATEDERVVGLCNDSLGSSQLESFRERFPERVFNVGIGMCAVVPAADASAGQVIGRIT